MSTFAATVPIERDEHSMRARRTAGSTRIAMGTIGVALIIAQPHMLPHPVLGVMGFVTIALTSIVQIAVARPSWLRIEESLAGVSAILIIGMGDQHVSALSILWLAAVSSGVMARGGRGHWLRRGIGLFPPPPPCRCFARDTSTPSTPPSVLPRSVCC